MRIDTAATGARPKVLYISYDGMLEPLGQSQVLAYQERLAASFATHILSFEKAEDWRNKQLREKIYDRVSTSRIGWHPLRYHKRPSGLATTFDILSGLLTGMCIVVRHRIKIIHARSYVAGVIALLLKKLTGAQFIFDMRGFWADERIDGGLWAQNSKIYRTAKWFERQFLLNADHVVSLTHAAVREMEKFPYLAGKMPPVTVIPTCADLQRFCPQPATRKEFLLGYVGSAGTWYEFDAVVACFSEILRKKPDARFIIINRSEHDYIRERLLAGGVPMESVELRAVTHSEVPQQIARMQAGIFFYKPAFSRQATSPTKLAEMLGCGVPCIANHGVGDMSTILQGERVGVIVKDFSPQALRTGLDNLLEILQIPDMAARCVAAAKKHFALDQGVRSYADIYKSLQERTR